MDRLQKAIKRAAEIRQESYCIDTRTNKISLKDACNQAAKEFGYDTRGTTPIYLLLSNSWNPILEWANR